MRKSRRRKHSDIDVVLAGGGAILAYLFSVACSIGFAVWIAWLVWTALTSI